MAGLSVDGALLVLKDAIRRNVAATCPTCGHQYASLNVSSAIESLTDAIKREHERESAREREAAFPLSGTEA